MLKNILLLKFSFAESLATNVQDQLTPPEVHLMRDCKVRAQRSFFVGSFGGGFVGWLGNPVINFYWF